MFIRSLTRIELTAPSVQRKICPSHTYLPSRRPSALVFPERYRPPRSPRNPPAPSFIALNRRLIESPHSPSKSFQSSPVSGCHTSSEPLRNSLPAKHVFHPLED